MPEIKNTFTQGKMNKDLDERIIPNGQYRDALNVQVSTSDDSDIGAVQNILGNTLFNENSVSGDTEVVGGGWECVGSIADEKKNTLYYFITRDGGRCAILEYAENGDITPVFVDTTTDNSVLGFEVGSIITGINIIGDLLFWTDGKGEPKKINIERSKQGSNFGPTSSSLGIHTQLVVGGERVFKNPEELTTTSGGSNSDTITFNSVGDLKVGDQLMTLTVTGGGIWDFINDPATPNLIYVTDITGNTVTLSDTIFSSGTWDTGSIAVFHGHVDVSEEHITVIRKNPKKPLNYKINSADPSNKNPLFKKIFPRFSYRYRYADGEYSTYAPFTKVVFNSKYPLDQEGETHDAKSAYTDKEPYNVGMINMIDSIELFDFVSPDMPEDVVQIDLLYKQEDSPVIYVMEVLRANDSSNTSWQSLGYSPSSSYKGSFTVKSENIYAALPENQLLRHWDNVPKNAKAQEISGNRLIYGNYTQNYTDNFFPKLSSNYTVRNVHETTFQPELYGNLISNYDFDNSSSPWTLQYGDPNETADPEVWWDQTNGWVTYGSTNYPVTSLYKMIYDNSGGWGPEGTTYEISFDVKDYDQGTVRVRIHNGYSGILPKGAFLKHTVDNTGWSTGSGSVNHVSFQKTLTTTNNSGNNESWNGYFWIQSDNFQGSIDNVVVTQVSTPEDNNIYIREGGLPSVKSQRNYQLGIVYGDKYGRETPVFTSSNSSLVIPFDDVNLVNPLASYPLQLKTSIKSNHPGDGWAEYYKFYVKETSGEYYNLVMDTLYTPTIDELKKEDHVWLSFPSSERNKISKDDYIILKRRIDSDNQISEDNKFRVLDVKNEAPDAIKYKFVHMGEASKDDVATNLNTNLFKDNAWMPSKNNTKDNTFKMRIDTWSNTVGGNKLIDGEVVDHQSETFSGLYYSFFKTNSANDVQYSEKYKITQVELLDPTGSSPNYKISLDRAITDVDDAMCFSSGTTFHDKTTVKFEKKILKDMESFSGRFFVKILASSLIKSELTVTETAGELINYVVDASQNIYWHTDVNNTTDNKDYETDTQNGGLFNQVYNGTYPSDGFQTFDAHGATNSTTGVLEQGLNVTWTHSAWKNLESYMDTNGSTRFFIDNMYVSGVQHGQYARESTHMGFYGGEPNVISDIDFHCDVSQVPSNRDTAGSYWQDPTTLAAMSWEKEDNLLIWANHNNSGASLPNTNRINGLDGMTTTTDMHVGQNGLRRWRTSNFDNNLDDVYGGAIGKHFLHISFLGPGVDLHDGNLTEPININNLHAELQGIYGGGVFTSLYQSLYGYAHYLSPEYKVGGGPSSPYNSAGTNPTAILMEKVDGSGTTHQHFSSVDQNGNNCSIPISGYDPAYQEAHEKQWDPTYPTDPGNKIADFINKLKAGRKFRFNGDPSGTLYKIKSVKTKKVYNHTDWKFSYNSDPTSNNNLRPSGKAVEFAALGYSSRCDATGQAPNWDSTGHEDEMWHDRLKNRIKSFGETNNRRLVYILELDEDPSLSSDFPIIDGVNINSVTYDAIEFIEPDAQLSAGKVSQVPAIWETEPKDNVDLDIYYEASQAYPINITKKTRELFAQVGNRVEILDLPSARQGDINILENVFLTSYDSAEATEFTLSPGFNYYEDDGSTPVDYSNAKIRFFNDDGSYITTLLDSTPPSETAGVYKTKFKMVSSTPTASNDNDIEVGLNWYNCFMFGNGVESDRIRDDFNSMTISNGVRASSTLDRPYEEEHRENGLIYSGLYNSTSGINDLNQFIMAEKITKDLNPTYGSIQKLFSRRVSLIAFCEDRIVGVTANKNALYNADGNPQLVSTNAVLGDANPFVGDYGISKNPESFAKDSYRAYFTDKQRGAILRLSMDGLTPISNAGMSDWFKDEFKRDHFNIIGSYDTRKSDYNLTFDRGSKTYGVTDSQTVTYSEDVKGWVSFKSFIQESGVSMGGDYYTFYEGKCWKHHDNNNRNIFYGDSITDSSITFIFNESPSVVKNFNTLNYDGDEDWVCSSIFTDQQSGTVTGFIEKEGKWFNYIKGDNNAPLDTSAFNFQGIGTADTIIYNV